MPNTGAMSSNAGSALGTSSPYTEFGPPLRMMPVGFQSLIQSTVRVGGWISEYDARLANATRDELGKLGAVIENQDAARIFHTFHAGSVREMKSRDFVSRSSTAAAGVPCSHPHASPGIHDRRAAFELADLLLVGEPVHDRARAIPVNARPLRPGRAREVCAARRPRGCVAIR